MQTLMAYAARTIIGLYKLYRLCRDITAYWVIWGIMATTIVGVIEEITGGLGEYYPNNGRSTAKEYAT